MSEKYKGFDGRKFLYETEWETYKRCPPVRYTKFKEKLITCEICGLSGTKENPLQWAHKIPFIKGVIVFGLTPDFLSKRENFKIAHRKNCNKACELTDEIIKKNIGILPNFLK